MSKKILILIFIIFFLALFFYFDFNQHLHLGHKEEWLSIYKRSPFLFGAAFLAFYVFCATFSIPGAALLTLASGFIFGFWIGAFIISLGSFLGAVFSFLISRFLFRGWIQKKFQSQLKAVNAGLKKDGAFYVFSLRLIPIFPFFAINALMGVTPIPLKHYAAASFLGMLPGTFVYVNAGKQLSHAQFLADIFSPSIILSFALLASLPWIIKFILKKIS